MLAVRMWIDVDMDVVLKRREGRGVVEVFRGRLPLKQ